MLPYCSIQKNHVLTVFFTLALSVLCLATNTDKAHAQATDLGVGIILGEPTGLTGKFWMSKSEAVDVHLAFSFVNENNDSLLLMSHYLMHFDVFDVNSSSIDLPVYVGLGAKLGWWGKPDRKRDDDNDDIALGIRIPIGVSLLLKKAPLEFFLEFAPALWVLPATDGDVDGSIGARFYF